jgi:hypothetical protein
MVIPKTFAVTCELRGFLKGIVEDIVLLEYAVYLITTVEIRSSGRRLSGRRLSGSPIIRVG